MSDGRKKKLFSRLKSRYRLVIMNNETLEEKASFNLRPLNVFVTTGLVIILLITLTTFLIAFTGLREYIPGYADLKTQWRVYTLAMKADSMEQKLHSRDIYLNNLRSIINGKASVVPEIRTSEKDNRYDTIHRLPKSPEDAELRTFIESQDATTAPENAGNTNNFLFFAPVKGTVTNNFDAVNKHYGIDIVAEANKAIKATLDGTVVFSNFTSETGYVIAIQHSNNFFSLYKHNSALLKKAGDYVKAGEVIAIIGNSGELTDGPHLHFELWFNGTPIDPKQYISF
jgi:murein DD-endopeptidase MepM/ murein hydrolase activator NlpD